ncbi:MAG: hypothetical protein HY744_18570 [Deltaproteobacteria bacterium]|nr:hypothetical protein [Deltaproteobacteria bacterium]
MRSRIVVGLSVLTLIGVAVGQGEASAQVPGYGAPAGAPGYGAPGGVPGYGAPAGAPGAPAVPPPAAGGLSRQAYVPVAQQMQQADSYIAQMESIRKQVRRWLEDARQQRDVVKTLCLDDKLNQLDIALRNAADRRRALDLAAKRGDPDLANHEFTILSSLYQRGQQLNAEANQCIGKEVGVVAEDSASTMDVDPNLPPEDPSEYPVTKTVIEPPNCASCYR